MAEIPTTNVGAPKCTGCNRVPPPDFEVLQRFTLFQCNVCAATFVVVDEATQYTTLPVSLTAAEPPPE